VLELAGILLLVLAWIGARSESSVAPQFVYLNLGIGGVVLAGTGNAIYLLGLRRAVRRRRADVSAHRRLSGSPG
jgi:hypothetical protein